MVIFFELFTLGFELLSFSLSVFFLLAFLASVFFSLVKFFLGNGKGWWGCWVCDCGWDCCFCDCELSCLGVAFRGVLGVTFEAGFAFACWLGGGVPSIESLYMAMLSTDNLSFSSTDCFSICSLRFIEFLSMVFLSPKEAFAISSLGYTITGMAEFSEFECSSFFLLNLQLKNYFSSDSHK